MNVRKLLLVGVLAATVGVWGCRKDTGTADQQGGATTTEQLSRQAGKAVGSAANYLDEKKDEAVAAAQKQLGNLEGRFEELKKQGAEAAGQSSEKLQELQAKVSEELRHAREQLGNLREAGADAWQKAASELGQTLNELQTAYDNFVQAYEAERKSQTPPNPGGG